MWSGAARSTPINDKTDRKKPSAWRKGTRKTRRSVNAVSIAQSENVFGAPGRPDGDGRHASVASAESHSVTSPRWTKACSYADQFPTRYFVLYFGWTVDLMSRSCTRSGHRGQRAYSCLVAAEGLCTNATLVHRCGPTRDRKVPRGIWTHGLLADVTIEWVDHTIPIVSYPYEGGAVRRGHDAEGRHSTFTSDHSRRLRASNVPTRRLLGGRCFLSPRTDTYVAARHCDLTPLVVHFLRESQAHCQSFDERRLDGLRRWRAVAQRAVGSYGVVLPPPPFDQDLRFGQGVEDLTVEQLVA